jgi:UDP-N-acetyl-2-amino-2-deoxyglucuronate dehydrogenase
MGMMHGKNFNDHPDAEVVAVCEMNPDLLAKAKEEFGVPGFSSIEDLLANCDAELMLLMNS